MLTVFLALPLCLAFAIQTDAKGPGDFEKELSQLVNEFDEVLSDQQKCKEVQKKMRLLLREVKSYFYNHPEGEEDHKILINDVEGFKSYVSSMTNSSASLMNLDEFKTGCRLIGGSFTYLEKGEHCLEIVKHQVGDHLCYLAFNKDHNNGKKYTITYVLDAPTLNKRGVLNSIVLGGKLDLIVDNRNWTDERFLKIASIKCEPTEW